MDNYQRRLQRRVQENPNDVDLLHKYIATLERVAAGKPADPEKLRRPGWDCPPEWEPWMGERDKMPEGSPDGRCVYRSWAGDDFGFPGRRVVCLKDKEGNDYYHPLPENHDEYNESDDWCIFCGHPDERK